MMKTTRRQLISSILLLWSLLSLAVQAAPTHLVDEEPILISEVGEDVYLVDFGRVAFGNIRLLPAADASGSLTVHFGEAMSNGRVNRKPPGTVRYKAASVRLKGDRPILVAPASDKRNTRTNHPSDPPAILTPPEWGAVLPFRWVEVEGWGGELLAKHIVRQAAFASSWDDEAASFESSDVMLDQIWELSRYSIKATTFAGVYVDGDRERIPYEADAFLNQLSHYSTDHDIQMARDTIDHLLEHGTWPTEWAPHMVFMVHADWMHTGDRQWMAGRYEALKSKTLVERRGPDGLIASSGKQIRRTDIVDWPKGERDGYVFSPRNTVVNAFYLRATKLMEEMARVLGKNNEADQFATDFQHSHAKFQQAFFDSKTGLYKDGADTDHNSVHANLFPLAFGLAPRDAREKIATWLAERGMRCSVYAAQYLMDGLFENGAAEQALRLMTAENDRSWRHMVESGTTISWEAWDQKYKPNQDWNHAWGAAPANLLPRYVLGATPLTPGWKTVRIRPNLAGLSAAKGKVPTPHGPILIDWKKSDSFTLSLTLPEGMKAQVELPGIGISPAVFLNGQPINTRQSGNYHVVEVEGQESMKFVVEEHFDVSAESTDTSVQ